MARRRVYKPKHRHYLCPRCHGPIVKGYTTCTLCGFDPAKTDKLFAKALVMFPGSKEI